MRNLARTLTVAALLPAALVIGAAPSIAGNVDPRGTNGTIKLSEVGGPEDQGSDPKLACTFEIEWYGFDEGADLYSDVTFRGQGGDAGVGITVSGPTHVFIGQDAAGGGTDFDAKQVYTLAFDAPAANAAAGHHVKVETANGSRGNDKKSKVFHVGPCAIETDPVGPTDPVDPTDPTPIAPVVPWTWDWTYDDPTCTALTVDYPANIPDGQANDVNVRFETATGSFTLNFHNNTGTWHGRTIFAFTGHPQWPAGLAAYDVVWVQVAGTNHHWQGKVRCGTSAPAPAAPAPAAPTSAVVPPAAAAPAAAPARATAQVTGFRTRTATIKRGRAPKADWVAVRGTAADTVELQQRKKGSWVSTSEATILAGGSARVTFPRLTKKGSYKFRVVVDGAASKPLVVKVR